LQKKSTLLALAVALAGCASSSPPSNSAGPRLGPKYTGIFLPDNPAVQIVGLRDNQGDRTQIAIGDRCNLYMSEITWEKGYWVNRGTGGFGDVYCIRAADSTAFYRFANGFEFSELKPDTLRRGTRFHVIELDPRYYVIGAVYDTHAGDECVVAGDFMPGNGMGLYSGKAACVPGRQKKFYDEIDSTGIVEFKAVAVVVSNPETPAQRVAFDSLLRMGPYIREESRKARAAELQPGIDADWKDLQERVKARAEREKAEMEAYLAAEDLADEKESEQAAAEGRPPLTRSERQQRDRRLEEERHVRDSSAQVDARMKAFDERHKNDPKPGPETYDSPKSAAATQPQPKSEPLKKQPQAICNSYSASYGQQKSAGCWDK
jgi:hypothetical protein